MKGKIFLLYIRTGGGHLAPARAIANYTDKNYPDDLEPVLIDGLSGAPESVRIIVEDGYRILQNHAKWYYEMLYGVNKIIGIAKLNSLMVSRAIKPLLEERILNEKPAKIVIFHFFLIEPIFGILKKYNLDIPVISVVTDPFTAHPVWFLNKVQEYIVFSSRVKEYALRKGISKDKVHQFPFVLDEKYSTALKQSEITQLKIKYDFDPLKKMILIIGGGDGIPKGKEILRKLIFEIKDAEIAIVCGKNRELFDFANRLRNNNFFLNLKVFTYVDFIYELLNMSDLVVTKCGASTFMEVLLSRKIPIVNSYIWEQEKGNVEFLTDNNLGIYEKRIGKLPELVQQLLADNQLYDSYISNIDKANLINGTPLVCEFIVNRWKKESILPDSHVYQSKE